jgi:hypothetical protein
MTNITEEFKDFLEKPREEQKIEEFAKHMVENGLDIKIGNHRYVEFVDSDGNLSNFHVESGFTLKMDSDGDGDVIKQEFENYLTSLKTSDTPKPSPVFSILTNESYQEADETKKILNNYQEADETKKMLDKIHNDLSALSANKYHKIIPEGSIADFTKELKNRVANGKNLISKGNFSVSSKIKNGSKPK